MITPFMKQHIIMALQEEFDRWEELLSGLSEAQIRASFEPDGWRIQDIVVHLWAWQQRSIARVKAAVLNSELDYPKWPAGLDPNDEGEDTTEKINYWIYETSLHISWPQVHQTWQDGFREFIELSQQVPERDLLDSNLYAWLPGLPLAFVLLASYDHHQEHMEHILSVLDLA
jgi:hypothetical protein